MSERKVILKMVVSLDGFATSPDGTHEWMFEWFGEDSTERSLSELKDAGVHVMGRRSYEIMGPHWAASEGPVARAMNDTPKAVFSRTLTKADWGPAEIFGADLSVAIAELKARADGGTILVHGGPGFAASLTRAGLVDEYHLSTVPIAIGAGRSPFAGLGAPEARRRRRAALPKRSPRAGSRAQTMIEPASNRGAAQGAQTRQTTTSSRPTLFSDSAPSLVQTMMLNLAQQERWRLVGVPQPNHVALPFLHRRNATCAPAAPDPEGHPVPIHDLSLPLVLRPSRARRRVGNSDACDKE